MSWNLNVIERYKCFMTGKCLRTLQMFKSLSNVLEPYKCVGTLQMLWSLTNILEIIFFYLTIILEPKK
jgi:hypothetical protein